MSENENIIVETLQALVASMQQQHETQKLVAEALTKLVNATGDHSLDEVCAKIAHLRQGVALGLAGLVLAMKLAVPVKHPIHRELADLFRDFLGPGAQRGDN